MAILLETSYPGIAILRVNRPEVRNALDWEAIDAFGEAIEQAHALPDLGALIVTGTGNTFIAGGDLRVLAGYPSAADGERLSSLMSAFLRRLEALPCPTIAAVNGPARGGGAEISLACDMRILAEDADLGLVQVTLGLSPGWGAGQRLLRMAGYSRALEWLVTGRILNPQEALAYGIANRITPAGMALQSALSLAQDIARQPRSTVAAIKRLLRAGLMLSPDSAAALEQAEFPPLWAAGAHLQAVERFLNRK